MSIANELAYLQGTKQAIRQAIIDKDVAVSDDDTFRSYADKISRIEGGGTGGAVKIEFDNYTDGESVDYNYKEYIVADADDGTAFIPTRNTGVFVDKDNNIAYLVGGSTLDTGLATNVIQIIDLTEIKLLRVITMSHYMYFNSSGYFSPIYLYNNRIWICIPYTGTTSSVSASQSLLSVDLETEVTTIHQTATHNGVASTTSYLRSYYWNNFLIVWVEGNASDSQHGTVYKTNLDNPSSRTAIGMNSSSFLDRKGVNYKNWHYQFGGRYSSSYTATVTALNIETGAYSTIGNYFTSGIGILSVANDYGLYLWGGSGSSTANQSQIAFFRRNSDGTHSAREIITPKTNHIISQFIFTWPNNTNRTNSHNYIGIRDFLLCVKDEDWYNKLGQYYNRVTYRTHNNPTIIEDDDYNLLEIYSFTACSLASLSGYTYDPLIWKIDCRGTVTIPTPAGTRICVDGGAEFEATTPATTLKSPFNGYVKYGSSGDYDTDPTEPDESITPYEPISTLNLQSL